jgi:hypothetical protein
VKKPVRHRWLWFAVVPSVAVAAYLLLWRVAESGRHPPANGVPVVARVVRSGDGKCGVGAKRQHCYRLALELHARDGAPRVAELDVNIEDRFAHRVQQDAWLHAVVDPVDPERVFVDVAAFNEPAPTGPAQAPSAP